VKKIKKAKKTKDSDLLTEEQKLARLDRFISYPGDFIFIEEAASEKDNKAQHGRGSEPGKLSGSSKASVQKRNQGKNTPTGTVKKAGQKGNK
jgi:hypothetical protein